MVERKKANPGNQSLPKSEILNRRTDFDALFSDGERTRSGFITLIHRRAAARRVGFAVSRRVGGAARRNRVKRLLREAYRKNRCRMGSDREFVVLAGESSFTRSLAEIEKELLRGLKKAGILND